MKAQYNCHAACEALQLQRRAAVQRALRALRAWSREALVDCQWLAGEFDVGQILSSKVMQF